MTLLNESEGAAALGQLALNAGLAWWWHPMAGGNPAKLDPAEFRAHIEAFASQLKSDAEQAVYIHCSAGIHRTGMFTYGALRRFGCDADAARAALSAARPVTGQDVGDQRLAWVEGVLATT